MLAIGLSQPAALPTMLDALPIAAYRLDAAGTLVSVSGGWERFTGIPAAHALAGGYTGHVHPADVAHVTAAWAPACARRLAHQDDFRLRFGDGAYRWVTTHLQPLAEDTGAFSGWFGTLTDIHELRMAEAALARTVTLSTAMTQDADTRARFVEQILAAATDFVTVVDLAGRVESVLYGAPPQTAAAEAAGGCEWVALWPQADRARAERALQRARSGEPSRFCSTADEPNRRRWDVSVTPLCDESGRPRQLLAVARDVTGLLAEAQTAAAGEAARSRVLAQTAEAMFRSLDFEQTVCNVAAAVTHEFATFCVIDIAADADGGRPRHVTARHRDPALGRTLATSPASGPWPPMLDVSAALSIPLRAGAQGAIVGTIAFGLARDASGSAHSTDDVRFAHEIAERAGLAFDRARAYERERRIAVTLQAASLPKTLPAIDHLYLSADYRPGKTEATNGGDWYDAFLLDDGRVALTVGDVIGNGLAAAVTMGKLRQAMRSAAALDPNPNAMLEVADRTVRDESEYTFATALAGIFDPVTHEFTFASAGHPGPALLHPDGRVEEIGSCGVLLGLRNRGETQTVTVSAPPGASLIFFTDGLLEATRDIDEGYRRVRQAIGDPTVSRAENPAYALVEHVLGGSPASDDIAVLIAEIGPSRRFDERLRTAEQKVEDHGMPVHNAGVAA